MLRLDRDRFNVPVGSFAEVRGGGTPPTGRPEYFDGDVPWLTPKDLAGHRGRYVERGWRNLSETGLRKAGARLLPAGSVLVSSRAPVGYLAIARRALATSQGFRSLVIEDEVLPQYLYYALRANRSLLLSYATGTTFLELSTGALGEVEIPLPDVQVQQCVADLLDPADDKEVHCLRLADRLLRLARALFLGARSRAEREVSLGDLADLRGGRTPSTRNPDLWSGSHLWATPKDLTANDLPFLVGTERRLTDDGLSACRSAVAPAGSILLATRATIGAATVIGSPVAFNQGCTAVIPHEPVLASYLFHELSSRVPFLESVATGTTFLKVSKRSLREIAVRLPRDDVLARLADQLMPLHVRAESLAVEAGRLAAARDTIARRIFGMEAA